MNEIQEILPFGLLGEEICGVDDGDRLIDTDDNASSRAEDSDDRVFGDMFVFGGSESDDDNLDFAAAIDDLIALSKPIAILDFADLFENPLT